MRKSFFVTGVVVSLLVPVGCAKGPAEAALKAAEQAVEGARPEIEKYVPEQFQSISEGTKAARESFDKGDYKAALTAAQAVPAQVQAAIEVAKRKKEELTQAWNDFQASIPGLVDDLKARVEAFAAMKRLPKGMDAAQLDSAKGELVGITEAWSAAADAFGQGDIPGAVAKAGTIRARVEAALAGLPEVKTARK